ncbi:hypothetical protein P7K49_030274 [Saguinus oedipus]|uniref:Uncharacterized protein n=1 Tax=Saguinus oedipus TaxID=9490 RepID=A0ABQ9U2L2_SAGOE|nr:hypothetical protein P7K49_030274 [Saguinus oedipus]
MFEEMKSRLDSLAQEVALLKEQQALQTARSDPGVLDEAEVAAVHPKKAPRSLAQLASTAPGSSILLREAPGLLDSLALSSQPKDHLVNKAFQSSVDLTKELKESGASFPSSNQHMHDRHKEAEVT